MLDGFQPNWVSPPCNTIKDILSERNLSRESFALQMGINTEIADQLLNGGVKISRSIAEKLEWALGASSDFWLTREKQYQDGFARLKGEEEAKWLKSIPYKEMVKLGWISETSDKLQECLNYFDVSSVKEWLSRYQQQLQVAAFRASETFDQDFASVAAWLRRGEIVGTKIACDNWDEAKFEATLRNIRPLTRKKSPAEFIPTLIEECAKCGVAVAIVQSPKGCRASGATRFVTHEKALLMLSFRYLSDDQFWFTFFHEAGHILLHGKKALYIEELQGDREKNVEEKEANLFAGEMLIPHELREKLSRIRGNTRAIVSFASEAGVSPGIVVGQLQFHGHIGFNYLNGFKRRYDWNEILKSHSSIGM